MQLQLHRLKIVLLVVLALALAIASGAHALSSALAKNAPETALLLWPSNGQARERLAYNAFVADVRKSLSGSRNGEGAGDDVAVVRESGGGGDLLQRFAAAAAPAARMALREEPLSTQAHAILALSEKDPARQARIIAFASQLNRRDLALQSLVLQSKVSAGDYAGTIETLDQILRVHPQRQIEFFPLLTNALRQSATIQVFRDLLSKPLPWRDSFLLHAVGDPGAARNLAAIRGSLDFKNLDFDRALIARLAANGDFEIAARLYRQFGSSSSMPKGSSWRSAYPPFDWTFADEPELRAQLNKGGQFLEFAIDPGAGGVLASRLIASPAAPFVVTMRYELSNSSLAKDLKLSLTCIGQIQPFFTGTVAERNGRFEINRNPDCTHINVAILGRSWTGGEPLNGSLIDVIIVSR